MAARGNEDEDPLWPVPLQPWSWQRAEAYVPAEIDRNNIGLFSGRLSFD
jgi:hypothetical protein